MSEYIVYEFDPDIRVMATFTDCEELIDFLCDLLVGDSGD